MMRAWLGWLGVLVVLGTTAPGRTAAQDPAAAQQNVRLRLYLECPPCERDYVRQELPWVDHMLDRQSADLHVLVISRTTGTGGAEFTMYFEGLREYAGRADTLRYVSSPDATGVVMREGLVRRLKVGLMRYVADLPVADRLQIGLVAPVGPQARLGEAQGADPWKYWVFTVGANGFLNGESRQEFRSFSGSLTANRTTEAWKVRSSVRASYSDSEFEVDSTLTVTSLRRSYTGSLLVVRSVGPQLSVGMETGFQSSTFGNTKLAWRLAPAIEYNFFPYAESTRRAFTAVYSVGVNSFDYREVTIFDETEERRPSHAFSLGYNTRQTWGSTSVSVDLSQFLHDTQKYRATVSGNASLRLVRGLSVNVGGVYGRVRDQLSVPRGEATRDEILLRLRQLQTSFFYFMSFGFSYRFGSNVDNIVNPRFNRGLGGGDVFFEF